MKNVLRNSEDGRLRAGWRILMFMLIFVPIATVSQVVVREILGGLRAEGPLVLLIIAISATIAVTLARYKFDRKNLSSLGLKIDSDSWRDLLFGFALSGAMAALFFSLAWSLGFIEDVRLNWSGSEIIFLLATLLIPNIIVGYWEELVFRGYLLQNMAEGMGMNIAIIVSCILYGIVHASNPNATILSSLIIVIFGYLRIYGYLRTGLLWLSMGMHIGWNYFQNVVFGFAASGRNDGQTLFVHSPSAADWLSGGSFGPEGSVFILPVILAALLAMYFWTSKRQREFGAAVYSA